VRKGRRNLVDKRQKITVDLYQSLAVTLTKADRRRSQEFEDCPSLAKLHTRDGARIRYRELVAIPESDQDAWITDVFHYPADQAPIETGLSEALAGIDSHMDHLSYGSCFSSLS
jgi:hypothetical protein